MTLGPAEHPFTMDGGNHCCKHFKTKDANGATRIGAQDPTTHCRADDYVACLGLGCQDHADAESKFRAISIGTRHHNLFLQIFQNTVPPS